MRLNITGIAALWLLLSACGVDNPVYNHNDDDNNLNELCIGKDQSLEVITWNIKEFPQEGNTTVNYLNDYLTLIDADVICLQEINSNSSFLILDSLLTKWDGYKANSAYYNIDLAILYKNTSDFSLISVSELFSNDLYTFPRPPLQLIINWNNDTYYVINNHLKAGGDAEDQYRRRQACEALADYVYSELPDQNVIIAGDLNDTISDLPQNNVFQVFLDDPDNFAFADHDIAFGSADYWSWGNGSAHLDHIIITNELFSAFDSDLALVKTLRIDDYIDGGWSSYEEFISDHCPVIIRLGAF